ncbi:MAG: amidohydrolase family protein, partial [Acidobacteriota bacterium]|nr:amidohydrolase family protein [Acidobacteriota bacterium]
DGDRWTSDPVGRAELVGEGWLVPGLVDVHTHPGARRPPDPLDEDVLREDLRRHVEAGVTLIRAPGLAGEPPEWFGHEAGTPRAVHAGPWIAQPGEFIDGWGVRHSHAEMPAVAQRQARATPWVKIIADWSEGGDAVPVEVLRDVVAAAHAEGARVAVHSQHAVGGAAAVAAGVDSLEHGMGLPADLLDQMARQGTALTPTLSVFQRFLDLARQRPSRAWIVEGTLAHPGLVAAAGEAGVRILAGTDSQPTGGVVDEIEALAGAGLPAHDALGAGSWAARSFLGLDGLVDGAPADVVVYESDPREDLAGLRRPTAIVLRGEVVTRR